MRSTSSWDEMFERFKLHFPRVTEDVVDWYASGFEEITAMMRDRTTVIYDDREQTIHTLSERWSTEEEEYREEFSRRLESKLRYLGMSQRDLAEETGISVQTISKYCNGKSSPSLYNIEKIANVLKCSVTELIDFMNRRRI